MTAFRRNPDAGHYACSGVRGVDAPEPARTQDRDHHIGSGGHCQGGGGRQGGGSQHLHGQGRPAHATAKPSVILQARDADLWIRIGLELEIGWEPPDPGRLAQQPHPSRAPRPLDASESALMLDVPHGPITRAMGDVHPVRQSALLARSAERASHRRRYRRTAGAARGRPRPATSARTRRRSRRRWTSACSAPSWSRRGSGCALGEDADGSAMPACEEPANKGKAAAGWRPCRRCAGRRS